MQSTESIDLSSFSDSSLRLSFVFSCLLRHCLFGCKTLRRQEQLHCSSRTISVTWRDVALLESLKCLSKLHRDHGDSCRTSELTLLLEPVKLHTLSPHFHPSLDSFMRLSVRLSVRRKILLTHGRRMRQLFTGVSLKNHGLQVYWDCPGLQFHFSTRMSSNWTLQL